MTFMAQKRPVLVKKITALTLSTSRVNPCCNLNQLLVVVVCVLYLVYNNNKTLHFVLPYFQGSFFSSHNYLLTWNISVHEPVLMIQNVHIFSRYVVHGMKLRGDYLMGFSGQFLFLLTICSLVHNIFDTISCHFDPKCLHILL